MAGVKRANTQPEMVVRSALHRLGFRFRLHRKDLPGSPDIVLPRFHTAIFVHGCFWHGHDGCRLARRPTTNTRYWDGKLSENMIRDSRKEQQLRAMGWHVLIVWQCETKDLPRLEESLVRKLTILVPRSDTSEVTEL